MSGDSERQEYGAIERRRLLQAAGAGSAIALSGCQGDGGGQTTTTTTQTTTAADDDTDGETTTTAQPELMEDQLDVARPKDFTKINYNRFNPSNFDWGSAGIRWDSLAIWHNGEQAYLPVLAKDWEFTTSKATVNLREGAHWWNGDPLTARDIWAVYWLFGAFNNSEKGAYWGSAGKLLDELKVADETTLEYVFDGEANPFLAKGAVLGDWNARAWINPRREPWKGWIESVKDATTAEEIKKVAEKANKKQITEPRGNSPWKVTKSTTQFQHFEKHDGHWNAENNNIPEFRIRRIPGNQQATAILSGDLDLKGGSPFSAAQSRALPDWVKEVWSSAGIAYQSLAFQYQLDDQLGKGNVKVRHAIAHAIDREGVAKVGGRRGVAATYPNVGENQLNKWIPEEHRGAFKKFEHDPDRAAQLLQDAGFSKSGGTWQRDGNPLAFSINVSAGKTDWVTGTQTIAKQLQEFGIQAELLTVEGASFGATVFESDDWEAFVANGGSSYTNPWQSYKVNFSWYTKGGGYPGLKEQSGDYKWEERPAVAEVPEIGDWYGDRTMKVNIRDIINNQMPVASESEFKQLSAKLAWVAQHDMPYYDVWGNPSASVFTADNWTFTEDFEWLGNLNNSRDYVLKTGTVQAKTK